MKSFLSKLPLPVSVLALSWVILGTTFQNEIQFISDLCMVIALILIILTMLKIIFDIKGTYSSLKMPVGLSLFSSFSMAVIMISVWMKGVFGKSNVYIWTAGVILQAVILIIFTVKYVISFKLKNVYTTWFLVFSGIGVAAITCRDFGMIVFGKAAFRFVCGTSILLAPFVLFRLFVKKDSTLSSKPLVSLVTLPLGVIIPAYIVISEKISTPALWKMVIVLQVLFLAVIISMLFQVVKGFYSTWSCYTLSATITLYATDFFRNYLKAKKVVNSYLDSLTYLEYIVVFILCVIILLAYFINTLDDPRMIEKQRQKIREEYASRNSSKGKTLRSLIDFGDDTLKKNKSRYAKVSEREMSDITQKEVSSDKNAKINKKNINSEVKKVQKIKKKNIKEFYKEDSKEKEKKNISFDNIDDIDDLID